MTNRFTPIETTLRTMLDEACPQGAKYAVLIIERTGSLTVLSEGPRVALIALLEEALHFMRSDPDEEPR